MVDAAMPVARATSVMPPYPIAWASVAAHTRRDRSVNTGDRAACFARSVARSTSARYHSPIRSTRCYFLTGPKRCAERVKRLLDSQVTNRVPDGCRLRMVPGRGAGHGHWRLVWDVHTKESPAVFFDDLPKQTARK